MSLISVLLSHLPHSLSHTLFLFQTPTASLCISLRANSTRPCSTNWACDWSCPTCCCCCCSACCGLIQCHTPSCYCPRPKLNGNLCLMSALRWEGGQEGDEEQVSSPATLLPRWDSQLNSLLTLQQHLDPSEVKGGHATPTASTA